MKFYFKIILILTVILINISCVYQNTSETKDETCSLKLSVSFDNNNKVENIFEKYDYFKIWVIKKDSKIIDSYLFTKKDSNDYIFWGIDNYLKNNYYDEKTGARVLTKVYDKLSYDFPNNFILQDVSVNAEYIVIGIPKAEKESVVELQFIKLNNGILIPSENTELYGEAYKNRAVVWDTDLISGKLTNLGNVILKKNKKGTLKIKAVPQMLGKNTLDKISIYGSFNNWDTENNNYSLQKNEIGVYTLELNNIGPYKFNYKFLYDEDNKNSNDLLADNIKYYSSGKNINFIDNSFYFPVISLINGRRDKGVNGANTNKFPIKELKYEENWKNKGVIEIAVGTDHYLKSDIKMTELIDIKNKTTEGSIFTNYETEIWLAENNNIKDVTITYDGKLNENGELISDKTYVFGNKIINNEKIRKFVIKKRYTEPLKQEINAVFEEISYVIDDIDFPDEAGRYMFTINVVDKNNNYSKQQVILELY